MGSDQSGLKRFRSNDQSVIRGSGGQDVPIAINNESSQTLSQRNSQTLDTIPEAYAALDQSASMTRSTLVVVHEAKKDEENAKDPLLTRLLEINTFEPIMYEVEKSFWSKKALKEVESRIKCHPLIKISNLCSERLRRNAEDIAVEQGRLTKCIKEIDFTIIAMMKSLTIRQKKFANHAEKFGKISELSRNLSRCNRMFNECIAIMEFLNERLPPDEKLEPFEYELGIGSLSATNDVSVTDN